ncbi:MAG: HAD family hydrolase [Bacteroidia bacterium]|nr:MAG: HAD family hydrolase [Bacteroidia bacterium]
MEYKCIIFDSDGVLVDSETITAKVFQKMARELGFDLDFESAIENFTGTSMKENLEFIEENIEGELPENFEKEFRQRSYEAFKTDLIPVKGIRSLIEKLRVPFCVASSGPVEKIRLNLSLVNLLDNFENRIFSSYDIGSWKPDPGIFLHAASSMGFEPEECVVIEDSTSGIRAALAGGFKVYALSDGKKKKTFELLGAIAFESMKELEGLLHLY